MIVSYPILPMRDYEEVSVPFTIEAGPPISLMLLGKGNCILYIDAQVMAGYWQQFLVMDATRMDGRIKQITGPLVIRARRPAGNDQCGLIIAQYGNEASA